MIPLSPQEQITMLTRIVESQGRRIAALEAIGIPPAPPLSLVTMRAIATKHATAAGLSLDVLRSRTHARHVAHARQDAMREMHAAGYSTPQIGRFFSRDHSTVLSGIKASEARAG